MSGHRASEGEECPVGRRGPVGYDILVTVRDVDADDARLEDLTSALRHELLDYGVDEVQRAAGAPVPDGARGIDAAAVGTLLVALAQSVEALGGIVSLVRTWLGAAPQGCTVELTIGNQTLTVGSATQEQQERLIEEFVRAVNREQGAGTTDAGHVASGP